MIYQQNAPSGCSSFSYMVDFIYSNLCVVSSTGLTEKVLKREMIPFTPTISKPETGLKEA